MPIYYEQLLDHQARLGIWKIEESEEFFKGSVPQHRQVTHPHKRLQHLAGRFLLQYLFPGFPYELIEIADTRKPFLPDEQYHFSISHCGDFAAAIVSPDHRVGIDIEIPVDKMVRIADKFLSDEEKQSFLDKNNHDISLLTTLWSSKEAVFKWYGDGGVDFSEHIMLRGHKPGEGRIDAYFSKTNSELDIHYRHFDQVVLAWVMSR